MKKYLFTTSVLLALLISPGTSSAVDTVETADKGSVDAEFYLGATRDTGPSPKGVIFNELVLGYGLLPALSVHLGGKFKKEWQLSNVNNAFCFGFLGTPLDTSHFDLDFALYIGKDAHTINGPEIFPQVELNIDIAPDRELAGIYFRFGEKICRRQRNVNGLESEIVGGMYLTSSGNHQLLVEFDMLLNHTNENQGFSTDIGGISLGYNVILTENFELITQAYLDMSNSGNLESIGFMLGFISTSPSLI